VSNAYLHSKQGRSVKRFTLIELLVVIGIFIVLASISLPIVVPMLQGSSVRLGRMTLRTAIAAARGYAVKNQTICALRLYNTYDDLGGGTSQDDIRGYIACYEIASTVAADYKCDPANSAHDTFVIPGMRMKLPLATSFGPSDASANFSTAAGVGPTGMALVFYSNGSLNPPGGDNTTIYTASVRTVMEGSSEYDYRNINVYGLTGKLDLVD
jgi:type II secretory pathway pseudopilin PulG